MIDLTLIVNNIDSTVKVQLISRAVLDMRKKINTMNGSLAYVMFIKTIIDSVLLSAGFCVIADNFGKESLDYNVILPMICLCLSELLDITVGCHSSQIIIDSMDDLCEAIEEQLASEVLTKGDRKLLKTILRVRKSIKFSALGIFDLKNVTILLIISNVLNYAVILIQTQ